jgi:hypothetical protein
MANFLPVVSFLFFFVFFFLSCYRPSLPDLGPGLIFGLILTFKLLVPEPDSVINGLCPGTPLDKVKLQIGQCNFLETEEAQAARKQKETQTMRNEKAVRKDKETQTVRTTTLTVHIPS